MIIIFWKMFYFTLHQWEINILGKMKLRYENRMGKNFDLLRNGWKFWISRTLSKKCIVTFRRNDQCLVRSGNQDPVYCLRGCWMWWLLWTCFCGSYDGGFCIWADWFDSFRTTRWLGLDDITTFVSIGLFWLYPITSIGSEWPGSALPVVLCWTIRIPPAFTASYNSNIREGWRRRKVQINTQWNWWVGQKFVEFPWKFMILTLTSWCATGNQIFLIVWHGFWVLIAANALLIKFRDILKT